MSQVGIVPSVMAFAAGVCAFAGLYHLTVAVRRKGDRVHGFFGALCLMAAIWVGFGVIKYTTSDPAVFSAAVSVRLFHGHLLHIAAIWFFAAYADERPRVVLWTLTVVDVAFLVLNQISPHSAYYSGPPDLVFETLPWGETVTLAAGPFAWGYLAGTLLAMATLVFAAWMALRLWQKGRRKEAVPLTVALGVVSVGFWASTGTYLGPFPPAELAFLTLIVLMSLVMADEVVEAGEVRGALIASRARMHAVVESAPEAILLLDGETGCGILGNQRALDLFGLNSDDVSAFHPSHAAPEEQADGTPSGVRFDRSLLAALAGRRASFPWIARHRDGHDISCEGLLVRLPGEDLPLVRFSLVDLRELEAAEARGAKLEEQLHQSHKLEAVGRLTGGVAHDFNNFLTVMRGSLELIMEEGVEEEERDELLAEALAATDRSAALTQRLLAFSRRQPLAPKVVDLRGIIDPTAGLLRRTIGEHIRMDFDVAKEIWPIRVDSGQLESALVNLSINSADAMDGGGRLSIGARNVHLGAEDYELRDQLSPGRYVRIHVSDTGHGMDPVTLSRVIEPFFTTKEVGKGTGLGLSMVYGFATQSGGTLRIESEPDRGTTVYLYFPADGGLPAEAV